MSSTGITRRTLGSALFLVLGLVASQAGEPVTFCAYNLKNWLVMESPGGSKRPPQSKPDEEKQKVIEFLSEIQPDILGVCEIGTREDLQELQSRLKDAGMDLPHSEFNQGADVTRSLALLSRFPISARHHQGGLPYQIGGETFFFQRGILDATVDIRPDFQVRFLGVHLKSKREVAEGDQALMRRNEAHLTRAHLDKIFSLQSRPNLVLYGDFNEYRNEPSMDEIIGSRAQESYMLEIPVKDAHGLLWTHFWDVADVYSRLDYLFVSRNLRPLVDTKKSRIHTSADFDKASDHRPVVLNFEAPQASAGEGR
ncbi:MAG TPA: hypothetical protein DIT64_20125 [Verrucomicrobiales bacterium]|nr:hypothetical protein [Verrucomicrobiales bacterium]